MGQNDVKGCLAVGNRHSAAPRGSRGRTRALERPRGVTAQPRMPEVTLGHCDRLRSDGNEFVAVNAEDGVGLGRRPFGLCSPHVGPRRRGGVRDEGDSRVRRQAEVGQLPGGVAALLELVEQRPAQVVTELRQPLRRFHEQRQARDDVLEREPLRGPERRRRRCGQPSVLVGLTDEGVHLHVVGAEHTTTTREAPRSLQVEKFVDNWPLADGRAVRGEHHDGALEERSGRTDHRLGAVTHCDACQTTLELHRVTQRAPFRFGH